MYLWTALLAFGGVAVSLSGGPLPVLAVLGTLVAAARWPATSRGCAPPPGSRTDVPTDLPPAPRRPAPGRRPSRGVLARRSGCWCCSRSCRLAVGARARWPPGATAAFGRVLGHHRAGVGGWAAADLGAAELGARRIGTGLFAGLMPRVPSLV
jgi:hypothetical protein